MCPRTATSRPNCTTSWPGVWRKTPKTETQWLLFSRTLGYRTLHRHKQICPGTLNNSKATEERSEIVINDERQNTSLINNLKYVNFLLYIFDIRIGFSDSIRRLAHLYWRPTELPDHQHLTRTSCTSFLHWYQCHVCRTSVDSMLHFEGVEWK